MPHLSKSPRALAFVILTILVTALPAAAQDDAEPSLEERAGAAFTASEWAEAFRLYSELTGASPENPAAWLRLGAAALNAERDPGVALAAYEKALELGAPEGPALYGIARAHAAAGDAEPALATLERLAEQGPALGVALRLRSEDDFDPLRGTERFADAEKRLTPCASDEYRQFDFWLGTWDVESPQGQPLGTNTVERNLDGCLLTERWESVTGSLGLSINYYDRETGTWTQTYRDNAGNVSAWPDLSGGLRAGAMVLENRDDPESWTRWTWTPQPDGRVRQMAETSSDQGETWTVVWDSYYVRSAASG
jgi:tetratricopeptide (TPR) repeat protein